jgi:hypothetical protein
VAGVVGGTERESTLTALYQKLGNAWYSQCEAGCGGAYYLRPAAEIGEREFGTIRSMLRTNLNQPHPNDVLCCVAETIGRFAHWPMPVSVVAGLAIQTGLVLPDDPDKSSTKIDGPLGVSAGAFIVGPAAGEGAISRQPDSIGGHYSVQRMPSEFDTSHDDLDSCFRR